MRPHLLLTYDFPPMGGGIARFMGELARHYPPGDLVVSTGLMEGADEVDARLPCRVERVAVPAARLKSLPGVLPWSRQASILARATNAEFCWVGQLKPCGYPAKWIRERVGVPFGVFAYGHDFLLLRHQAHRSRMKRVVARGLLGAASCVVACSEWTAELVRSVLEELDVPMTPDRVRVVHLGTDTDFFRPGLDTGAVRERYHLGPGRWLITVARVVPHKGADTVMRAMQALGPEFDDVHYAVVGTGRALGEMKALARQLGLASRVKFLSNVPDADLPALYNVASAYVGMSRQAGLDVEGFGISFAEAAACGLPVIAGRSGGVADVVAEGETGLLVPAEEPTAAAEAIGRVLGDLALAERLGREGRARVERYFRWDRVVQDLRAVAHEFAGEAATPATA
ncbi:MAG TPA: glycosyltransferase family 4 protein [Gemmatimonadales bacterium]|nr:glycosyltransferase family 4 protein [Gemmatimonadales bacterium]